MKTILGISIEDDVPFSTHAGKPGKWVKIYESMKPGQSFVVNCKEARTARAALTRKSKKYRIKTSQIGKSLTRVWRI